MGIALTLAVCFASTASAQGTNADPGQGAPPEQQKPTEQKPSEEPKCVSTETSYKKVGNTPMYEIALTNSCEKRLKCTVHAYVVGSHGPATGKGTVILAPKSKGALSQRSYVMKVKQIGGMATSSFECKTI